MSCEWEPTSVGAMTDATTAAKTEATPPKNSAKRPRKSAGRKKVRARKVVTKAVAKAPQKREVNKSAFVRNLSSNLSAADVIAKAKAAGFAITAGHVYAIRAAANAKAKRTKKSAAGTVGRPRGPGRLREDGASNSYPEALLRAVAAEVGLARAIDVLQGERARVLAALR